MFLKVVQNFGYKSVMKMSKIMFVFFIFSLLLSCIDFRSDETLKEEGFHQIHNFFKSEYNLILSKEDFDINMEVYYKPFSKGRAFLLKPKKPIEYKSKYFKNITNLEWVNEGKDWHLSLWNEETMRIFMEPIENDDKRSEIPFFNKKYSYNFFKIIDYLGLRPYVLNNLIYDKSKGNDFEKIEKIFDEYPGIKYNAGNNEWECGLLDEKSFGDSVSFIYVQDKECVVKKKNYKDEVKEYSLKGIEKYGKIFKEYFSQEKNLMKIDWYEFMKFNNITPILIFFIPDYLTKKDAEKIRNEIAKHYNKKDFIILLQGTDTYLDKNGNKVHEAFDLW